ncbi:hypothetical protein [Sinorhizobium meliloti]|uniref:hypothetical protein n=1 Tax=Rhizobium meliloti TaxID=382 RepID=UPI003F1536EB
MTEHATEGLNNNDEAEPPHFPFSTPGKLAHFYLPLRIPARHGSGGDDVAEAKMFSSI